MARDRFVSVIKEKGCPECGGKLVEKDRERVPGGIDWHHLECDECGHKQTV